MTAKQALDALLAELPKERVQQVLDYARFLSWQEEQRDWQEVARAGLARAYGPNEPEYMVDDLRQERQR